MRMALNDGRSRRSSPQQQTQHGQHQPVAEPRMDALGFRVLGKVARAKHDLGLPGQERSEHAR